MAAELNKDETTISDDLVVVDETQVEQEKKKEDRVKRRYWFQHQSAARAVAVVILLVVATVSLGTLIYDLIYNPVDPPTWAQSALSSILTAAVAFLFSHRDGSAA